MTDERLLKGFEIDAIEELAEKATPGPWMRDRDAGNIVMKPDRPGDDWDGVRIATTREVVDEDLSGWRDAEFIAAASPDVVIDLIAQLRYMVLNAEGLSRVGAELKRERDDALASLDARWEHSDHLTAKYYQRMRAAEREMHSRELHHFESEKAIVDAVAACDRFLEVKVVESTEADAAAAGVAASIRSILTPALGELPAEPQGEPSDAQALEDFLGKLAGDGAYTLDFTSASALHGHIVSLLKRDIAALRAAGGVR